MIAIKDCKQEIQLVALVKFPRSSFNQEYSYFTDIEDLQEDYLVIVPTNNSYGLAIFSRYSTNKLDEKKAEKWIVKNVNPDIEAYEDKLFIGGFD